MPSPDTFTMPPVAELLDRWLSGAAVVVDPFARNGRRGTLRNDLNPDTSAEYHMDAAAFCVEMEAQGWEADAVLFDPPYSPRQISEVYAAIGKAATREDTQNARLYKAVRDPLGRMVRVGGVALSFGWNSAGFGQARGFEMVEILLCAHGGAHNDTICVVERKVR
jgi:hypothetical protein